MNTDEKYMDLALKLAERGEGYVNPNPMVGAVVVKNNEIIGEGWHKYYGGPHAEVYALEEANENAEGSTIYVTLEPCSHYGKTPPCAEKLIDMKVKRCVIATLDPNPLVAGKGVELLRNAGIEVEVGVREEKAKELNRVFLKYIKDKEPYLFLKCAITLDGKLATNNKDSKWITNDKARAKVQRLRHKYMGIMVGASTLVNDNPRLTARIENGIDPYRIVIDPNLRTPLQSNFVTLGKEDGKSIVITSERNRDVEKDKILEKNNIKVIYLDGNRFKIDDILKKIGELKIDSVLLEGGSLVISESFREDRIDGGEIFIAPKILGGGIPFVDGFNFRSIKEGFHLDNVKFNTYDDNISVEFYK